MVLVEWVDSSTFHGWVEEKDIKDIPCYCFSVGWKIKANREVVTLSAMRSDNSSNLRQIIPRGCIKSVKVIKEGKCQSKLGG